MFRARAGVKDGPMRRPPRQGLVLAFLGCAGCVTTAHHPLDGKQIQQLRAELDGRRADVWLVPTASAAPVPPPEPLRGDVFIEKAMVRVVQRENVVHRLPLIQVREIDADHTKRGAVIGTLAGVITAVAAGVIFATVVGPDCSNVKDRKDCSSATELGTLVGLVVARPAAAVGAGLGAMIGAGPIWRFSADPAK